MAIDRLALAEKAANVACALGGGSHAGLRVACPVAVKLARNLIETRNLGEAVRRTIPGKRVLINQTREFLGRNREVERSTGAALPIIRALLPEVAPGLLQGAPTHNRNETQVQGMAGHIVHTFPRFFAQSDKFRELLETGFDPRRRSGGGSEFFQPGESGF